MRLISVCVSATVPAARCVTKPTASTTCRLCGVNSGRGRATRYTPAATIVAAWVGADTGVGPSLASGGRGGRLLKPKTDEQVGAEPHQLPADIEEEEVIRQDQGQHRGAEQREIG